MLVPFVFDEAVEAGEGRIGEALPEFRPCVRFGVGDGGIVGEGVEDGVLLACPCDLLVVVDDVAEVSSGFFEVFDGSALAVVAPEVFDGVAEAEAGVCVSSMHSMPGCERV